MGARSNRVSRKYARSSAFWKSTVVASRIACVYSRRARNLSTRAFIARPMNAYPRPVTIATRQGTPHAAAAGIAWNTGFGFAANTPSGRVRRKSSA
ncbi:MAG: hypothetical protein ACO3IB_07615 [Phycisphaerales bacterium]